MHLIDIGSAKQNTTIVILFFLLFTGLFATRAGIANNTKVLGTQRTDAEMQVPLKIAFRTNVLTSNKYEENLLISNYPIFVDQGDMILLGDPIVLQKSYIYPAYIKSSDSAFTKTITFSNGKEKWSERFFFNIDKLTKETIDFGTNTTGCENQPAINILIQQIDKTNCISEEYHNYLNLEKLVYNEKEVVVNSIALNDLKNMLLAAKLDGIEFTINSSYRDYNDQEELNSRFESYYGSNINDNLSAKPGHSEHQLGLAIDFTSDEVNASKGISFEQTNAFKWLEVNAYKYGFILSYPKGKEEITGYRYEPWHWRYIGKENAIAIKQIPNITLREYLYLLNNENNN